MDAQFVRWRRNPRPLNAKRLIRNANSQNACHFALSTEIQTLLHKIARVGTMAAIIVSFWKGKLSIFLKLLDSISRAQSMALKVCALRDIA